STSPVAATSAAHWCSANSPAPQPNSARRTSRTLIISRASRTRSRRRSIRPRKRAGDGCVRCAGRSSRTTSTAGHGRSSTRWRRRTMTKPLNRSDVLDQPPAVDLLIIDAQPAAVVDRRLGLVGHRTVHVHHHRSRITLCGKHAHAHYVRLADQLTFACLRDDVFVRAGLNEVYPLLTPDYRQEFEAALDGLVVVAEHLRNLLSRQRLQLIARHLLATQLRPIPIQPTPDTRDRDESHREQDRHRAEQFGNCAGFSPPHVRPPHQLPP